MQKRLREDDAECLGCAGGVSGRGLCRLDRQPAAGAARTGLNHLKVPQIAALLFDGRGANP